MEHLYYLAVIQLMLSKNPIELPEGRKFSKDEVAQALRLGIIAELDAINLYLQLAKSIDDEAVKRVFGDIAKEEKTHVGEFLALLKSLDEEQALEIVKGAEEVSKLTGIKVEDPSGPREDSEGWEELQNLVKDYANSIRRVRPSLPVTPLGRGIDAVPVEEVSLDGSIKSRRYIVQLREISQTFEIAQASLDYSKSIGKLEVPQALTAASKLVFEEEKAILDGIKEKAGMKVGISSWDEPGSAVNEVASALSKLLSNGFPGPFLLFLSPPRYAKLVSVHERTGIMELQRLKALIKDVIASPAISDEEAVLISSNQQVLDVVIGADTVLDYTGPIDGSHAFRLWETLAVRVKDPRGIVLMR
jgi:uncharacterized linocin/CFP29 family protein